MDRITEETTFLCKKKINTIEDLENYESKMSNKIENFFIDYYPQEIYENNMQATDLLYFSKTRAN